MDSTITGSVHDDKPRRSNELANENYSENKTKSYIRVINGMY